MGARRPTRGSDIGYPHWGGMRGLDQKGYCRPAVKWNIQVNQWKRIPDAVRHAFREAMAGRPGPVHIEFPEDLLPQKGDPESADVWKREEFASPRAVAYPDLVRRAAEMMLDASMPMIHCGGGTQRAGAGAEARALAEYLGCPVTTGAGLTDRATRHGTRAAGVVNTTGYTGMNRNELGKAIREAA